MKFRVKSPVVEGMKYIGENWAALNAWGNPGGDPSKSPFGALGQGNAPQVIHVMTAQGRVIVAKDMWIVRDATGHFFLLWDDEFNAIYEQVAD